MGQEPVRVPCPDCGVLGELSDPGLSRWQCRECGHGYFLRRCSACARVSYVDGLQGYRQPWPCTWCGHINTGFSQNRDQAAASAAELAADVARHRLPASPDGPRADDQVAGTAPRPRRTTAHAVLAVAAAAVAASILVAVTSAGAPTAPAGAARHGSATRAVRVTASAVGTVDLRGAPGQLNIVGTGSGQVMLTGQLHWAGRAPVVVTRLDRAAGVLLLSVRCAPASPCTQDLRLAVPARTAATIRQPAGRIVVTRLSGPLSVTAANADISASGLNSPALTAVITSGHLTAAFAVPPRQVTITLASAQATIRLPDRAAYRVIRRVTSGYIGVGIPQAASAPRTVTARIDSGELELLPAAS